MINARITVRLCRDGITTGMNVDCEYSELDEAILRVAAGVSAMYEGINESEIIESYTKNVKTLDPKITKFRELYVGEICQITVRFA